MVAGAGDEHPRVAALRQRGGAGTNHHQRDFVFREDFFLQDRPDVAGAGIAEQRDRLCFLYQRACLLDCLGNLVAIVFADQLDLLAVNSACGVYCIEIELGASADMVARGCEQAGQRRDLTDDDVRRQRLSCAGKRCEQKYPHSEKRHRKPSLL